MVGAPTCCMVATAPCAGSPAHAPRPAGRTRRGPRCRAGPRRRRWPPCTAPWRCRCRGGSRCRPAPACDRGPPPEFRATRRSSTVRCPRSARRGSTRRSPSTPALTASVGVFVREHPLDHHLHLRRVAHPLDGVPGHGGRLDVGQARRGPRPRTSAASGSWLAGCSGRGRPSNRACRCAAGGTAFPGCAPRCDRPSPPRPGSRPVRRASRSALVTSHLLVA